MTTGKKAITMALIANITISVAKFVGFLVTGSSSMLAETVHSLADSGNQLLLIIGGKRSKRGASKTHQFGYGGERYFYSFIVALTIFLIGGIFAIYEGIAKVQHPHELHDPYVAIAILVVAIIMESFSLRTAVTESNLIRKMASWREFIRFSKTPELPVLLLEDLAAVLGLTFALFGVCASYLTSNAIFDGIATLLIGLLLVAVAIILGIEMKSLLLGESVIGEEEVVIKNDITAFSEVVKIIHMRTLHLSPEEILLAVKIAVDPKLTMVELSALINNIEKRIRRHNDKITLIYIEPDILKKPRR